MIEQSYLHNNGKMSGSVSARTYVYVNMSVTVCG